MYIRKALLIILVVQVVAAIATAAAVLYLQKFTVLGVTNAGTIVAMAIAVLGTLIVRGARIGSNPVYTDMATSVASNPNGVRWADYEDMAAGLSYGTLLILGGLMWLLIIIGMYKLAS